jgi:hypothetical protein
VPDINFAYVIEIIRHAGIKEHEESVGVFTSCKKYWQGRDWNAGTMESWNTWIMIG